VPRVLVACALGLLFAASARAEGARVARSELRGAGEAGLVFFLAAAGKAGAAAVGAAHSFDRTRLAEVGEIAFVPPGAASPSAISRRYFASPGQAFYASGASPRDDFLVFALEAPPEGVRVLEPALELPAPGARVFLLGIRARPAPSEATLPGTVVKSTPAAIEVELDAPADLRGWGGAPVILAEGGKVIGLLQAAWPSGSVLRTSVGPISGVAAAMAKPFEGGLGRLFATLAPPASAANSPAERRYEAAGSPYGDLSPDLTARELDAALAAEPAPALGASGAVRLTIDVPEPGAIFGDAAGAFLAGSALAKGSGGGRFDLFVVIDTSDSTSQPSGVDVDGDGELGAPVSETDPKSSDPGDSILAAEVAAAEKVVDGLDPERTRVGVVTFAGEAIVQFPRDLDRPPVRLAALTREPLTSDYRRVRAALYDLSRSEPYGRTHMAAGIDLATLELLGLPGSVGSPDPGSTKMILFFTDGQPTLPYLASELGNVEAVRLAADRARRAGVRIHSFAIGPEALEGPIAAVEMAEITRGLFTPVPDPGRLSDFVEATDLADIEEVTARNTTSGEAAHEVRLHADGSWEALVPLRVGKNRIEVRARSSRGDEASANLLVHYAPGSVRPAVPAELLARYNQLLQNRLLALGSAQREKIRRELTLEIDRERASALARAAAQRKELDLRAAERGPP
jgi:von Willebrand factor type A domain